MSFGTPSVYQSQVGSLYEPIPCVASSGSYLVTTAGQYGTFIGFTAFNTLGTAASFRIHDGTASSLVAPLTCLQTVGASANLSGWFGPQGLPVASGLYLERTGGTTEIVLYGA